ncbi:MAG: hypothetical protein ACYDEV_07585 [Acidiferrobacter sp.]
MDREILKNDKKAILTAAAQAAKAQAFIKGIVCAGAGGRLTRPTSAAHNGDGGGRC